MQGEPIHIIPDESLLLRYAEGKVTMDEMEAVESWVNESEENRKIFKDILMIHCASDIVNTMNTADPKKSLKAVHRKVRRNRRKKIFLNLQRVAAFVAIPLLAVSIYFFSRYQDYKSVVEAEQFVEIKSAPGAVMSFSLADGTKVWLNSNSYIKYPAYFTHNTREVILRGEAYFSVAKDEKRPFFVSTDDRYKIRVLGTEFNVEAYSGQPKVYTTLVKGSVELMLVKNGRQVTDKLNPGEQLVWDKNAGISVKNKVNTIPLTAWKEGKIILKDNSMEEVINILSKRYSARFIIQNQKLWRHHFTGTFTNQQLVQILEHFKISSNIRYEIRGHDMNPDGTIKGTTVVLK